MIAGMQNVSPQVRDKITGITRSSITNGIDPPTQRDLVFAQRSTLSALDLNRARVTAGPRYHTRARVRLVSGGGPLALAPY